MSDIEEIKIIMLGNSLVGKTSFIIKYIEDKFQENYIATLGLDFKQKNIKLKNGKEIRVRIFDTAGQERFKSVSLSFIKKANGIILMYDISNKSTFDALEVWMKSIKENANDKLPIILAGNKSDISEDKRKVFYDEGNNKANEFKIPFFETSCKEGINIKEVFEKLIDDILKSNQSLKGELKVLKNNIKEKKCC